MSLIQARSLNHVSKHATPLVKGSTLLLTLLKDSNRLLSSLDTAKRHGTKSRSHAVSTVDLGQLHTADDEARGDFAGALDDGVFGAVHVEAAHAAECFDGLHADEALDAEGAEGAVVAGGGDYDGGVDGVWVHAGLVVVVHADLLDESG